jgi:uncharacterized protein YndB with AHSA1/START domain
MRLMSDGTERQTGTLQVASEARAPTIAADGGLGEDNDEGQPVDPPRPPRARWPWVAGLAGGAGLGVLVWGLTRHSPDRDPDRRKGLFQRMNDYAFKTSWRMEAPPADVFRALEHVEGYPLWWPEVRSVSVNRRLRPQMKVRGLLPYTLAFAMTHVHSNRRRGTLEARLTGDLVGRSKWTVSAAGTGSEVVLEEEAELGKRWLRVLGPLARPLFRANHALMMRHARIGLADLLEKRSPAAQALSVSAHPEHPDDQGSQSGHLE